MPSTFVICLLDVIKLGAEGAVVLSRVLASTVPFRVPSAGHVTLCCCHWAIVTSFGVPLEAVSSSFLLSVQTFLEVLCVARQHVTHFPLVGQGLFLIA